MPLTEDFAVGFLAPVAVAAGALLLLRWIGARDGSPVSHAVVLGFLAAFALFDWAHGWQWLPYAALGTLLAAPVIHAPAAHRGVRWGTFLALAIFVALLIVPDWERLDETRHSHQFVVAVSLFSLCVL